MTSRLTPTLVALALVATALSGCTPPPKPEPTPGPPFATEEEAFAAAEETYRAYIDAFNRIDLGDPDTFEPVLEFSTGEVNATERKTLTEFHAEGLELTGPMRITSVHPMGVVSLASAPTVTILACADVSEFLLVHADGSAAVPAERADIYALEVDLLWSEPESGFRVAVSASVEDERCDA